MDRAQARSLPATSLLFAPNTVEIAMTHAQHSQDTCTDQHATEPRQHPHSHAPLPAGADGDSGEVAAPDAEQECHRDGCCQPGPHPQDA